MTDGVFPQGARPLEARLWGPAGFHHAGVEVVPTSRKAVALLAYLAVTGTPAGREELATLLWGPGRLANVRQALYTLRKLPRSREWLSDGVEAVSLNAVTDLGALARDVAAVEGLVGQQLLAGLDDRFPTPFEEWLAGERVRAAVTVGLALVVRAEQLEASGSPAAALGLAKRALALDPYSGERQRLAMRVAYLAGAREEALAGYEVFAARLRREFGTDPDAATADLAARIERGETVAPRVTVSTLAESDRRTLQALAVARGGLRLDGLARVLGRSAFELTEDLARMQARGLLSEHQALGDELRSSLLDAVSAPLRRLLHERIAGVMRNDPSTDQGVLAQHLLAAGETREAALRALAAADAALGRGQNEAAERLLYLTMWAAQDESRTRLQACLALENLAAKRADIAAQEVYLAEARRLAWELQDDLALAEGEVRLARLELSKGRVGEALEAALEALQIALRLGDASLSARARNAVGAAHFYAGDIAGAEAAFADNLDGSDEVESFRAHNNLGSISAMLGRLEDSYRHFDAALTIGRRQGSLQDIAATLNNLGATAERLGDYQRAERHFREGSSLARKDENPQREAEVLLNLAVVYLRQGQLGPAWNTVDEVELLIGELSDRRLMLRVSEVRGEVLRVCGLLEDALAKMIAAQEIAKRIGDERKQRSLWAQRLAVEARSSAAATAAATAAVASLEASGLKDVAPWLRLELAAWATDVAAARVQLGALSPEELKSAHQRHLRDLVIMRMSFLAGADDAAMSEAAEAMKRLRVAGVLDEAGATAGRGTSTTVGGRVVERPKALYLARLIAAVDDRAGARAVAEGELVEQAAGLPVHLRAALLLTPATWLPDL